MKDRDQTNRGDGDRGEGDPGPDALWRDYLEGDLSEAGMEALRQSFESDPGARPGRIEALRLHRELGLVLSTTAGDRADFVAATMARLPGEGGGRRPRPGRWMAIGAALAAALMGAVLFNASGRSPAPVLRVIEAAGSVEWVAGGGQAEPLPGPGSTLPGGVLALRGPDAWAELAFNDGSTFTLTGIARATVSDEGRKIIALDGGRLLAEIEPQGEHPLLVFTPAAELEVLGTSFRVLASEERATLDVTQGRVEMVRYADGRRVEVAAGEFAVATRSAGGAFRSRVRPQPTASWSASLRSDPTQGRFVTDIKALKADLALAVDRGELTEAEALERFLAADGGLEAVALWKKVDRWKKGEARPGDLQGPSGGPERGETGGALIAAGPVSAGGDSAPVLLADDSRILVTGWVARPTRLTVGLTLAHADRRHAGKVSFTSSVLPGGTSFELDLLGGDFVPYQPAKKFEPLGESLPAVSSGASTGHRSGSIIEDWWCLGHDLGSGLKIHSVVIQPAAGRSR